MPPVSFLSSEEKRLFHLLGILSVVVVAVFVVVAASVFRKSESIFVNFGTLASSFLRSGLQPPFPPLIRVLVIDVVVPIGVVFIVVVVFIAVVVVVAGSPVTGN